MLQPLWRLWRLRGGRAFEDLLLDCKSFKDGVGTLSQRSLMAGMDEHKISPGAGRCWQSSSWEFAMLGCVTLSRTVLLWSRLLSVPPELLSHVPGESETC